MLCKLFDIQQASIYSQYGHPVAFQTKSLDFILNRMSNCYHYSISGGYYDPETIHSASSRYLKEVMNLQIMIADLEDTLKEVHLLTYRLQHEHCELKKQLTHEISMLTNLTNQDIEEIARKGTISRNRGSS